MLGFFCKIRKSLMEHPSKSPSGNKTRTYLKYPIGEIALVMIEILLALQINNWNAERIDEKKEEHYQKPLTNDKFL